MLKKFQSKSIAWILIGAFLLFGSPYLVQAQARDTGSISGTIFAKDGTSPYPGAVVTVKDVSTNQVYKSVPTDSRGGFIIDGLPKGVYVFGVSTSEGDFNSDSLIGVEAGKTAKISIALTVFDEKTAPDAEDVYEDQNKDGEALV
ncbi:MAG: carboxypeptidase-like regulatory domain-containing protein, partial [Acidobacteria bacterium]|nr:carboxypeptidase-like regulatory domain-containing protein [Acidobacteriota bacterium]